MSFHEMDIGTGRPFDMVASNLDLPDDHLQMIQEILATGGEIEIYVGREGADYYRAWQNLYTCRLNAAAQLQARAELFGEQIGPVLVQVSSPDETRSITWAGPASLVDPRESNVPAASQEFLKGER